MEDSVQAADDGDAARGWGPVGERMVRGDPLGADGEGASSVEGRHRQWAALVLGLHIALVLAGIALVVLGNLDPKPKGTTAACARARAGDDSLLDLAHRTTEVAAKAQLRRWDECDAKARKRGTDALTRDGGLIAVIGSSILLAVAFCWPRPYRRVRLAAEIALVAGIIYVLGDHFENKLLAELIRDGRWSLDLPRWSAVKLGAFFGALPIVITSIGLAIGDVTQTAKQRTKRGPETSPGATPSPGDGTPIGDFARRCKTRFALSDKLPVPEIRAAGEPRGLGVCCSGGGVRSAAFTLGALQAMEDPDADDELGRIEVVTAVSGGSYMAAAWVTGRHRHPATADQRGAWARSSPEEQHLRRHASYMAPRFKGKLWALVRFLLGFTLNLLVFILAAGALSIPYGWVIHEYGLQPAPLARGAAVDLPAGGCLETIDGPFTVRPGTRLRLDGDANATLDQTAAAQPPQAKGTASVKITSGDASITAEGAAAAAANATVDESGVALAGAATQAAPTTTPTTVAPVTSCPATSEPAAPPGPGDIRAATAGRVLAAGTKVRLQVADGLAVRGLGIVGCPGDSGTCVPVARSLGHESRLVSAPVALLELDDPAIVCAGSGDDACDERAADSGEPVSGTGRSDPLVLYKACGQAVCERLSVPLGLDKVVLGSLAAVLVAGWAMLMVRSQPAASRRTQWTVKVLAAVAAGLALAVYIVPEATIRSAQWRGLVGAQATLPATGTIALIVAFLGRLTGSGSSGGATVKAPSLLTRTLARLKPILLRLVSALAGPLIVVAIALAWLSDAAQDGMTPTQIGHLVRVLLLLGYVFAYGDLNEWSLHPYYRERLRSAFATDVRPPDGPGDGPPDDGPNPREDPLQQLPATAPELVLCAAANLADDRVTPPGRPVASWVFSRSRIGCAAIGRALGAGGAGRPAAGNGSGMVPPGDFAPPFDHLAWTWTAVAVSGAAFAPAMGKMTRLERFAFALGNLRLGVWYPNPALFEEDATWYSRHWPRPWYLFKEAVGRHKADDRWIYVTDGGHYENLGLVEALRCRCQEIYVFDAAGDKTDTFGTLADAMRLARAELEVEIDIDPRAMKPDGDGVSRLGVWAGTVRWPKEPGAEEGLTGWLVIAKLAVPGSAPFDVIDLARSLPSFPTHPTADQLFTDQKFEAYRALGQHLGAEAVTLGQSIRRYQGQNGPGDPVAKAVGQANADYCKRAQDRKPPCPPEKQEAPAPDKPADSLEYG